MQSSRSEKDPLQPFDQTAASDGFFQGSLFFPVPSIVLALLPSHGRAKAS
jgi:hypothetical protein